MVTSQTGGDVATDLPIVAREISAISVSKAVMVIIGYDDILRISLNIEDINVTIKSEHVSLLGVTQMVLGQIVVGDVVLG
jgi:hypothetical protein